MLTDSMRTELLKGEKREGEEISLWTSNAAKALVYTASVILHIPVHYNQSTSSINANHKQMSSKINIHQ